MCTRVLILEASATGLDDLAYKMVRMCSIFGYVPDDPAARWDFEAILSGDTGGIDVVTVTDEALDLLNEHAVEGKGYEFDDNSVYLYEYCEEAPECDT